MCLGNRVWVCGTHREFGTYRDDHSSRWGGPVTWRASGVVVHRWRVWTIGNRSNWPPASFFTFDRLCKPTSGVVPSYCRRRRGTRRPCPRDRERARSEDWFRRQRRRYLAIPIVSGDCRVRIFPIGADRAYPPRSNSQRWPRIMIRRYDVTEYNNTAV